MKNIIQIILIIVVACLLHIATTWWFSIAIAGILGGLLIGKDQSMLAIGLSGLLAGLLLWGGYAAWINMANDGIMTSRLGMTLGGISPFLLVLGTGVLGGLYSASGSLLGGALRKIVV